MLRRPSSRLLLAALASAALLLPASGAGAVEDVQPARVEGETRLETAAAVAGLAYPQGVTETLLATSVSYPDALAGAPLAGALEAPVLLNPPAELAATTRAALEELGVERITIVGAEPSISAEVEAELAQRYHVTRIAGESLYHTAADLARTTASIAGGLPTLGQYTTLFLASGEDFADALAASGPAYAGVFPMLLTAQATLPAHTSLALDELQPQRVVIFGGPAAIAPEVEQELQARQIITTRLGGFTRTDTARIVAEYFVEQGLLGAETGILARGNAFPDAVTAGVLSGQRGVPILLSATSQVLSDETRAWFSAHCDTITVLQVVGGTDAVSIAMANEAEAAAESCGAGGR